jgi:phage major head subunit gpT-like protein
MGSELIAQESHNNINRVASDAVNAVWDLTPNQVWGMITEVIPTDAETVDVAGTAEGPQAEELLGSKSFKGIKAYAQAITIKTYHASISVRRKTVDYDKTGTVGKRITQWAASAAAQMYDQLGYAALTANGNGFDATALLANTHGDDSEDNLETAGPSLSLLTSMTSKFRQWTKASGEPYGLEPNLWVVGPADERTAREVTGADTIHSVATAGALDAAGIAAVTVPNVFKGMVDVVVWNRIGSNNYHFLCATQYPGIRPLFLAEGQRPVFTSRVKSDDSNVYYNDQYEYSVQGDFEFASGIHQSVIGSVT